MHEGGRAVSGVQARGVIDVIVLADEPSARDALVLALRGGGFVVRAVTTADEAIDAIVDRTPDVIVCDLVAGSGVTARDLAVAVRADAGTMHLGLVAVSELEPRWDVARPFDAFLRKPLDAALLADVVRAIALSTQARDRALSVARGAR